MTLSKSRWTLYAALAAGLALSALAEGKYAVLWATVAFASEGVLDVIERRAYVWARLITGGKAEVRGAEALAVGIADIAIGLAVFAYYVFALV